MEEAIFQMFAAYAPAWIVGGCIILMCAMFTMWTFEHRYPCALQAKKKNAVKVRFHNIKMSIMAFAALWSAGMAAFLGAHFSSDLLFVAVFVLPLVSMICLFNLKAK